MTVKLPIAKKYDNKSIETYGLTRVTDWTRKELLELQKNSKIPICVQLQNGNYFVATYTAVKVSDICWKVGDIEFTNKRTAIFYCALLHLSKIIEANELHKIDAQIGQFELDKSIFRIKLDRAHAINDQFKIDVFSSRYEIVKSRLRAAKQELEKIISWTKYYIIHLGT